MHMNLSPHFMFNALSSVQWLWSEGKREEASRTFGAFIRLWQKHWTAESDSMQSLNDELASLEEYAQLEAARKDMSVAWNVECVSDMPLDAQVPALLFQPAVENALWHGFSTSMPSPHVQILIERLPPRNKKEWMCVRVLDNGRGLPTSPTSKSANRKSLGLQITRERMKALDPEASLITQPAKPPWSTETRFELPVMSRET